MSDDSLKSSAMSQGDGTAIGEEGEPSAAPGDVDIEHLLVEDDPRQWSPLRKNVRTKLSAPPPSYGVTRISLLHSLLDLAHRTKPFGS